MNRGCLMGVSHFVTLLFGVALGLTIVVGYQDITGNYGSVTTDFVFYIGGLVAAAGILRMITLAIFRKDKKFAKKMKKDIKM